jgi:hypothetical protein
MIFLALHLLFVLSVVMCFKFVVMILYYRVLICCDDNFFRNKASSYSLQNGLGPSLKDINLGGNQEIQ